MNSFLYSRRAQYKWHTANAAIRIRFIATVIFIFVIVVLTFYQIGEQKLQIKIEEATIIQDDDYEDENAAVTRQRIKDMMLHAWNNYARLTWGHNELRPISKRSNFGGDFGTHKFGATIFESLDTLHIMGLHEELNRSRDWIDKRFSLDHVDDLFNVYELTSRLLGPMLTLYSLTGDDLYRKKAVHIADKIMPAFDTPTGIPWRRVIPKENSTLRRYRDNWSLLSEFGALHLEFFYLSEITGSAVYKDRVEGLRRTIVNLTNIDGLYPNLVNIETGQWSRSELSINRFYDYLLKSWLQVGKTDPDTIRIYKEALLAVTQNMVVVSPKGLTYVSELKNGKQTHRMSQMACFSGGLFVLGAVETLMQYWEKYAETGIYITDGCHQSFAQTPTKLGPEIIGFSNEANEDISIKQLTYYNLRPEVVESYMVIYRLSHDQKFRTWGLQIVRALEKFCRTPNGYTGIMNVYDEQDNIEQDNVQRSYFLGSTLKYLYLLFSDDIPLHQWVFNSRGHFLPIKGANLLYRKHEA